MKAHILFTDFVQRVQTKRLLRGQKVLWQVLADGVDPKDLSANDRELARLLFGDVDAVPAEARTVVALLKGARIGGTYFGSLFLLYLGLTVDLSVLGTGEVGFGVIVAPDMKTARQGLRYIIGAIQSTTEIASLLVGKPGADSVTLQRSDGRVITLEVLAASVGGSSLRGRSYFGVLLDESCFFRDQVSGAVNDLDLYRATSPRIIPGGRMLVVSTAWAERGLLWDLVQKNYGNPTTALAAIAPTMLVLPTERNRIAYEEELERDPDNAAREFGCKPLDGSTSVFFDSGALSGALVDDLIVRPEPGDVTIGAIDTGFRRDPSSLVIVTKRAERIIVADVVEVRPEKGKALVPSVVLGQFAQVLGAHKARWVVADNHYIETVREHLSQFSIIEHPGGAPGKAEVYTATRDALRERKVEIPQPHKRIVRQLQDVSVKAMPGGGLQISSPRRAGSHGDIASAFCAAVWYVTSQARRYRDGTCATATMSWRGVGGGCARTSTRDYSPEGRADHLRRFLQDELDDD